MLISRLVSGDVNWNVSISIPLPLHTTKPMLHVESENQLQACPCVDSLGSTSMIRRFSSDISHVMCE